MKVKSILIVEDDEDIRLALRDMLEGEGYRVNEARNGEEGLRLLSEPEKPCCVLLDLMMPVMTGQQFLVERQKSQELLSVPVFVVSAIADRSLGLPAEGVSRFFKKPVDMDTLLGAVAECCQSSV